MKKHVLSLLALLATIPSVAQITADGYYRVKNYTTNRYLTVVDNKTKGIDHVTTTADLLAINTIRSWEKIESNPASVIYIEKKSDEEYNVKAQGCDAYAMFGRYLCLAQLTGYPSIYKAYQTESGTTVFLSDEIGDWDEGYLNTTEKRAQNWVVTLVDKNSENYFGIKPTIVANSKHYASFFASFPFKASTEGMKVFYISKVDYKRGVAVAKEIAGEVVPASTPLIVECPAAGASENKVDLVASSTKVPTDNLLTGVYFNYAENTFHTNRVKYEPQTMRVLGECVDGRLGLVKKEGLSYIPANTCYLSVDATCPSELAVLTEKEYADLIATGIDGIAADGGEEQPIYTVNGKMVGGKATTTEALPRGIYVTRGKKFIK